jgi:hypothetical protein
MNSQKKLSNKEFKIMESAIVNHSFILDALMNILIENGVCTFDDIKAKIEESTQLIESHQNSSNSVDLDDDTPTMNYYGPMGEA